LNFIYTWLLKEQFPTDHELMSLNIPGIDSPEETQTNLRYTLSLLNDPILFDTLATNFECKYTYRIQEITSKLELKLLKLGKIPRTIAKASVDVIDRLLTSSIIHICDSVLPKYNANAPRTKFKGEEVRNDNRQEDNSYLGSIRLFKRSQKAYLLQNKIRPINTNQSPLQEAYSNYKDMHETQDTSPFAPEMYDMHSAPATLFSPESIHGSIKNMNQRKHADRTKFISES
jgi:hypothetical protein